MIVMTHGTHPRRWLLLLLCTVSSGCGDDGGDDGAPASATGGDDTGGVDSTEGVAGDAPASSSGPPPPAADGEPCTVSADCASGACYDTMVLGAYCGKCEIDADCEWGCNPPQNPMLPGMSAVSQCGDGSAGSGCVSDEACAGDLVCSIGGFGFGSGSCGECNADAGCADGRLCTIEIDLGAFSSTTRCVEPSSLPDGAFCEFESDGDEACVGSCVEATFPAGSLGVCSSCETDADCADGLTCLPPGIDVMGGVVIPGECG